MDLYLIGLKLYLINRACGGIPLSLATHFATTYALSASWWTTKKTISLIGYGAVGTYKLITHVARPSSHTIHQINKPKEPVDENWEPITPCEYEPSMDWELVERENYNETKTETETEKIVFLNNENENNIQSTLSHT